MATEASPVERMTFDLEKLGVFVLGYGLALILLWVGGMKFTEYEAKGIEPLVDHSPFLSWAYHALGLRGLSDLLGFIEIMLGLLIASRTINARLSAYGSLGAVLMFLITLSFLFTTPGVTAPGHSFPMLSANVGQFIAKDLVLLGAAIWTAGEGLRAAR